MVISMEVNGKFSFVLEDGEIVKNEFVYGVDDSKYAKGSNDTRQLKIIGDIMKTLNNKPEAMKQIREWSKYKFKDSSYYHNVKVIITFRGEELRSYEFTKAFIIEYNEAIDPHSGTGTYTMLFEQKKDKRVEISIDGSPPHPTLSEVMADRRASAAAAGSVAAAGVVNDDDGNSPYWVPSGNAVHRHIRIVGSVQLRTSWQSGTPDGSINEGQFEVFEVRRTSNGSLWFRIRYQDRDTWFTGNANVRLGRSDTDTERIITVANYEDTNSRDSVTRVFGWWEPDPPNRRGGRYLNEQDLLDRGTVNTVRTVGGISGLEDRTIVNLAMGGNPPRPRTRSRNDRNWVEVRGSWIRRAAAREIVHQVPESLSIMLAFVEGDSSITEAMIMQAVNDIAAYAQSAHGYTITSYNAPSHPDHDFDRFDNKIIAWSFFWNNREEVNMAGGRIVPNTVKAIATKESGLGYGSGTHAPTDVMSVFNPGDPAFRTLARIGEDYQWPGDGAIRRDGYGAVQNMFVNGVPDRSLVTPMISIAFGTRWLGHHITRAGGDEIGGIRRYNSNSDNRGFQPEVNRRFGAGSTTNAYVRVVTWARENPSNDRDLALRGWAAIFESWRNFDYQR